MGSNIDESSLCIFYMNILYSNSQLKTISLLYIKVKKNYKNEFLNI